VGAPTGGRPADAGDPPIDGWRGMRGGPGTPDCGRGTPGGGPAMGRAGLGPPSGGEVGGGRKALRWRAGGGGCGTRRTAVRSISGLDGEPGGPATVCGAGEYGTCGEYGTWGDRGEGGEY